MSTWAALLADIRTDLKDSGATPRWADAALYLWAKDAIRDYSLYFPLVKYDLELTKVSGAYPLPADCLEVVDVQCPLGRYLDKRLGRPFGGSTRSLPTHYTLSQGQLYIAAATDAVFLTYKAVHGAPSSAADAAFNLSIPVLDEELIRLYVKAKANEQLRSQQSGLDRFKLGSGDRQDNPLQPEVESILREYRDKISARTQTTAVILHRQR